MFRVILMLCWCMYFSDVWCIAWWASVVCQLRTWVTTTIRTHWATIYTKLLIWWKLEFERIACMSIVYRSRLGKQLEQVLSLKKIDDLLSSHSHSLTLCSDGGCRYVWEWRSCIRQHGTRTRLRILLSISIRFNSIDFLITFWLFLVACRTAATWWVAKQTFVFLFHICFTTCLFVVVS